MSKQLRSPTNPATLIQTGKLNKTDKCRKAFEIWGKNRYNWINAPKVGPLWDAWQEAWNNHYELLDALKEALQDLEQFKVDDDVCETHPIILKCRAAIAKAEGNL